MIHALSIEPTTFTTRFIAFMSLTFCLILHGVFLNWGLRLQNILGFFKLIALLVIAIAGMFHVIGVPGFELQAGVDVPRNFERDTFWEGSGTGANAFVTGMTNVIWYARLLFSRCHQV
jgi:amino acid transporter